MADDASREAREAGPAGAEFEVYGNTGHHVHDEVDTEDASPEAHGAIPFLTTDSKRDCLDDEDQKRLHNRVTASTLAAR